MRNLAKNISIRTLTLRVIFVAIIAVSVAGLSRHSPLLEWSALVAALFLVIADPLNSHNNAAAPTAEGVDDSAIKGKIFNPNKTAQAPLGPGALVASKV
jgi:hypothetical protein